MYYYVCPQTFVERVRRRGAGFSDNAPEVVVRAVDMGAGIGGEGVRGKGEGVQSW